MKNKKLFALLLTPLMVMTGCGKKAIEVVVDASKESYTIGICQLVQHEALDAATNAFKKAVKEGVEALGKTVSFLEQNASGDAATCVTIANTFVSKGVDIIMANATPALQACYNSTDRIPILATSITEYGVALNRKVKKDGSLGTNVSGTSDLAPLTTQAQMMVDLFPKTDKVGLLYCSSEPNSKYQIDVVEKELKGLGKQTKRLSFTDSNDLSSVLNGAKGSIDALYIPTDNTCATNGELIDSICRPSKLPVFAGEEGICRTCGAITLSISYDNIGKKTGEMAVELIKNTKNIKTLPIAYDENPVKKFNKAICDELGIEVPAEFVEVL